MTNLTLQQYCTKLAKHQPPDLRNPTEKGESAGLQKNKREEVTCFKLCNPRPQVTLHKKYFKRKEKKKRACPRGTAGGERESSPHLSMVTARVSSSDDDEVMLNVLRCQLTLTHSHGQPEGGGGKNGGGRVLHCCHPPCPRSGTINIIILGRFSIGQRAETGNTDQTITSLKNKQAQIKEFPTEIQQTRGRGKTQKRNSTKLHKTTKLQQFLEWNE